MSRKLKVGLIGLGGIMGYAHMPRYRGADDVEIVAICDIIPENAQFGTVIGAALSEV